MSFNGNEGSKISLAEGAALTLRYRIGNQDGVLGAFYGRNHIEEILAQSDCQGIRIYLGKDVDGKSSLVLVGADSAENDLLDVILDVGQRCPPNCSGTNPLNADLKGGLK
ncbi:hypothetical protein [Fluviicola sp.]|uniref:hypothetical protein n=1 Tax=Fluviicola sp. TaxID=1917219 RepID=UPI0031D6C824